MFTRIFKKFVFVSIILLIVTARICAKEVSTATAEAVALTWMYQHTEFSVQDLKIKQTFTISEQGIPIYYIYNFEPHGSVIISADDVAFPIIAFSATEGYSEENHPPAFDGWMNNIRLQIHQAIISNATSSVEAQEAWSKLKLESHSLNKASNVTTVGPLLTTAWGQGWPYNKYCPQDNDSDENGHVVTGCVATAIGQIVKYWEHPDHGEGSHSYYSDYGRLSANFGETYYDWSNMPDELDGNSSTDEIDAVATLLYHCGVAVDMKYSAKGSGALDTLAYEALRTYFRYEPDLLLTKENQYYTYASWEEEVRKNLDTSWAVYYSAMDANEEGGHAFVCDGYYYDYSFRCYLFHFNWGWNGDCNDYWYKLYLLKPGAHDYTYHQIMITRIRPKEESSNDGNDTPQTATALTVPHSGDYEINPEDDIDWYRIHLTAGTEITMYTERINNSELDLEFYFYGPHSSSGSDVNPSNAIADNDDGHGNRQPEIDITIPQSGYYFLRVANCDNDPEFNPTSLGKSNLSRSSTGEYALHIESGSSSGAPDIDITDIWWDDTDQLAIRVPFDFNVSFENIGDETANDIHIIYEGYYNGSWCEFGTDFHSSLAAGYSTTECNNNAFWDKSFGDVTFRVRIPVVSGETNTDNNIKEETWYVSSGGASDNNDTPTTATAIEVPHTGNYEINPEGDIDWYRIYFNENTEATMYTERINGSTLDPKFYFYGPNNPDGSNVNTSNYIAKDDDKHGNYQPEIKITIPNSGYYFLRVAHFGNNPLSNPANLGKINLSDNSTGEYGLHIEVAGNAGAPDMVIDDIWPSVSPIIKGDNFTFYVDIENNGDRTASNIQVYYEGYYNDNWQQIGTDELSSLTAGGSESLSETCQWTYSSGNVNFRVRVPTVAGEKNTNNNIKEESWTVNDSGSNENPNVAAFDIWPVPDPVIKGQSFDFYYKYENRGKAAATNFDIILEGYHNGWNQLAQEDVSYLEAESLDQVGHLSCIWNYSSGSVKFRVCIANVSNDIEPGNNIYEETWTVNESASDNNDSPWTATIIEVPHTGNYEINPEGDIDWYRIYLNSGVEVTMYTERINSSELDPEFYFYGPHSSNGSDVIPSNYIATDDDDHGNRQPEIDITISQSGYYFLRVAYYDNNPIIIGKNFSKASTLDSNTGAYALTINRNIDVEEIDTSLPTQICLYQNYPNPFNPETTIRYTLPRSSHVLLKVFSTSGQEIKTLIDKAQGAGDYHMLWQGTDNLNIPVASGLYFYQLITAEEVQTKKMILMR